MNLKPIHHNHSVCLLAYHFVTVTKCRRQELQDNITVALFTEAIKHYPLTIHTGEIMPDHVHFMVQAPATIAPAQIAKIIKGCSQASIKKLLPSFTGWSKGYYISSVGGSSIEAVERYIKNQKA